MAYATAADMKRYYRWPTVAELVSAGLPGGVRPTESELDDDATLAAHLDRAAGQINSALRAGQRYTVEQLESLTGDSREFLVGLNCELCWASLHRRNGASAAAESISKNPEALLESLRKGVNIFDLEDKAEAGLPDASLPSVQQVINSNDLSQRTPHYFASPWQRRPLDQR